MGGRIYGPFTLPYENGSIRVAVNGLVELGERHRAWPWERPRHFTMLDDQPAWNRYTTNGQEMLRQLALGTHPVYIRTGYTLLAALLMSDTGLWFTELANMRKHHEDGKDGMLLASDLGGPFGLKQRTRMFFSDALHGTMQVDRLTVPPGSIPA